MFCVRLHPFPHFSAFHSDMSPLLLLCYTDPYTPILRFQVTCHTPGHTTRHASSFTVSLSCLCPYVHLNQKIRPASRSLHSYKSGVTHTVTRYSPGHTTRHASSFTGSLSCLCPYDHLNPKIRPASRSLYSYKSSVTHTVTRHSPGHISRLTKLRTCRNHRVLFSFSVASSQRIVLHKHCSFHQKLALSSHAAVTRSQYYHKRLRTCRGLRTLSRCSVAFLQRVISRTYPSFNSFSSCAVAWLLF
jgi:hypothetical protein